MRKVSEDQVKEILSTELTPDQIGPFATAAHRIVEDSLSSEGYSEETLIEIQRWLAAHLVAIRDPQIADEEYGDASRKFLVGKTGLGLDATVYGQQVKLLDRNGRLSTLSERKRRAFLRAVPSSSEETE